MNFIKRLIVTVAIFAVIMLGLQLVLPGNNFDVTIHTWGWLAFFGGIFVLTIGRSFLAGAFSGMIANINTDVVHVCDEVLGWLSLPVSLIVCAHFLPQLVSYTSVIAIFSFALAVGLGCGISDIVVDRLGLKPTKSVAKSPDSDTK